MSARFYAPEVRGQGERLALSPEEAAHLARVLRLKRGAPVIVFDGRGHEFDATVLETTRSQAIVGVGAARTPMDEPTVAVTLAQAVLKGDSMDEVVRDAVMMGAAAIQPVLSRRSEATLAAVARGRRVERWQRVAVSSAKQCGRATVPPILQPRSFEATVEDLVQRRLPSPGYMLVEPAARADARPVTVLASAAPAEATVIVGPEGGWTTEEIARAAASCHLVRIGARTIRANAMSTVALSALFTLWREF